MLVVKIDLEQIVPMCGGVCVLSHVRLFETPWTITCQAPLSMGFSRQEYWSGLPFPSTRDLLLLAIKPKSPGLQSDSLPLVPPGKPYVCIYAHKYIWGLPVRDADLIPGSGRSPAGGHGNLPVFLPGESHEQRNLVGYNP